MDIRPIRHWFVRSGHGRSDYRIVGRSLPEAVQQNFGTIARVHHPIGSVAGYRLKAVTLRAVDPRTTSGGRTFSELVIEAWGLPLAHRPADPWPVTTVVTIEATPEDVPADTVVYQAPPAEEETRA